MPTLYAQPYSVEDIGFEFESLEDYRAKAAAHAREEFELDFLDGTPLEQQLFALGSVAQYNLEQYFEAIELASDEQVQLAALLYVDVPLDEALERYEDVVAAEHDSTADWAFEFIDSIGGPAALREETLASYFNYESYGRDAELGGDIIEMDIGGTRYYADAGSLER